MGEIGFPRSEFLHDLKWWEVKSIIRGYNARQHSGWEQARLIAYNARFCMGVPEGKTAPTLSEWLKFSWEQPAAPPLTNEEQDDMLALINAENERLAQQKSSEE